MDNSKKVTECEMIVPVDSFFVFTFVKRDNVFIHTSVNGDLEMGLTPSDVVNNTLDKFFPANQVQSKLQYYEKAWNGEAVKYLGSMNDYHYVAFLEPILEDGKVVEVKGTAVNITEAKMNEDRMQEIEKRSMLVELSAGIAHEIRNPLTSIIGFSQIIKERTDDTVIKNYIEIMLTELNRINQIVNEFMFISKPAEAMTMTETNINALIMDVIKFMEPQSNLRSIKINPYLEEEIVSVCDPNQIKQVLINLIQNALEATIDSNKSIEICLYSDHPDTFTIAVKDKGYGISKERQGRLFEPFYTTKEKGTGLGLLISRRIIEVHKGTINFQSDLAKGTVMKVKLPVNKSFF